LLLLKHGAKQNGDKNGRTPLHIASYIGSVPCVEALLGHGASVHIKDNYGNTSLGFACAQGNQNVVELLIDKGADIKEEEPTFLLHRACQSGNKELVQYLLDKGLDVNVKDKNGRTALFSAIGNYAVVLLLLERGADQDSDKNYVTPLHVATYSGSVPCVEALLRHGAIATARDRKGITPLHLACDQGHQEIAELLIEKGANIEQQDSKGNTPLIYSCANGQARLTRLLLKKGARAEVKNHSNQTAMDFACGSVNFPHGVASVDCVVLLLTKECFQNCTLVFLLPNFKLPKPSPLKLSRSS
jgi:ankyrin repeat protein